MNSISHIDPESFVINLEGNVREKLRVESQENLDTGNIYNDADDEVTESPLLDSYQV